MTDIDPREKILAERRERRRRYHAVFTTMEGAEPIGRWVLEDLRQRAFYHTSTFGPGGHSPEHLRNAREGMRNFMLETDQIIREHLNPPPEPTQRQAVSETVKEMTS